MGTRTVLIVEYLMLPSYIGKKVLELCTDHVVQLHSLHDDAHCL